MSKPALALAGSQAKKAETDNSFIFCRQENSKDLFYVENEKNLEM